MIRPQDKILQSTGQGHGKDLVVTNDGATILRSIQLDNPAAKILVGAWRAAAASGAWAPSAR